ncbi:MAG TPA: hypothetical protein VMJ75_03465 [Candidatus Acidoferrales bacterium]|nr:hypothetical protein [Candidatus Acidoferrales bacterium]
MKKLFAGGLFMVGVASMPVALSPGQSAVRPIRDYSNDPRLVKLRGFFQKWACPAERYSDTFLEAADVNRLDWRLLPSICFVESTGGKSAHNNNLFGWDSGRAHFPSPAAGIHSVGYQLSHSDLYRAKSLDGLLLTYNPNPDYVQLVKSVMRRIHPSPKVAALADSYSRNRTPM